MLTRIQWMKRAFAVVAGVTIAIVAIVGLLFGKVVEETLFLEIAKWVLMAIVLAVIVCAIAYAPIGIMGNRRNMLYPEYGKKWWIEDIKRVFRK